MKHIRILKRVLKFAVDQGWLETNPVGLFKCTYVEPSRERMTMEEVMTLYHKEFAVERLAEVRDVFLFSCYTGFAYQDVYNLTPDNIVTGSMAKNRSPPTAAKPEHLNGCHCFLLLWR